jgi:penicillin-binding protein 2
MNANLLPDLSIYASKMKKEHMRDSIRSVRADSIRKVKADSIKKAGQIKTAGNSKSGNLDKLLANREGRK